MFEHNHPPVADDKGKKTSVEGSSDDNPIELGGHALATLRDTELESISKVLYEMPATPLTELKVEEAIELLHVSTKFQFEAIHEKAICILDSAILPPWRRYSLGVDCLVDPWILRSYVETCSTVDYAPSELSVEFSRRNEMDKLTALLSVREQYRTTLLIYSYEDKWAPYARTAQHMHTADSLVCLACLKVMKALLQRILSSGGPSDLDGADGAKLPLLEDRVLKGIQPRSQNTLKLCDGCRTKGAVHQILGVTDLENEVRRVMRLSS